MAKIFRLIPAIVVSIAAFFELCLTGRADRSWRLARNDSFRPSLAAGAKGTPAEHLQPRPGIVISRKRAGATPPAPALRISRVIYIGKYMAMTIFLAFVITVFVSCPGGRSFATEDGKTGTVQAASTDQAKDGPSSDAKTMRVTAYCPCPKCCGKYADGITANGHKIKPGDAFVAAPKTIPFGTSLIIPGYNKGKPVRVMDRGGAITAGRLDVFFSTHKEALEWGVQNVIVKSSGNQSRRAEISQ